MRALLLLFPAIASAQSALPNPDQTKPGAAYHIVTKNGACVWWHVYLDKPTPKNQTGVEFVAYCSTVAEFSKIGGRIQTIVNAADPLKSLQTLPNRVQVSKINCVSGKCTAQDPALGSIVADMNAARGK